MKEKETTGLRTESLVRLTWPIFLQNLTNSAVMFVDFWFFSYLSDEIAGVIGQLMPIFWVGAFVIPVFASTGVSVASQYMGAGRKEKVVPTYMMNLLLSLALGIVFTAVMVSYADELGRWIGMSSERSEIGGEYFGIMGYYFLFMSALVAYNAVLSSRGMTHWLMYVAFVVATVNLSLNSLFVFGFGFGIKGIAFSSVVGAATALGLSFFLVHRRLGIRFRWKGAWPAMRSVLRPILRIGVSNAVEPFSYAVQQIVIASFIVALGITAMATHGYASRLQMFQITFGFSLANAGQILMAHWAGSGQYQRVHGLFWRTIGSACVVAAIYCLVLWQFAEAAIGLFTDDPAIIELGKAILLVSVFLEPARAINIIGGFSLRTVGDARFPLIIGVLFIWGILPVIFALDHYFSLSLLGLWVCFAVDEIVRAGINLWRWQSGKWKSMVFAHE